MAIFVAGWGAEGQVGYGKVDHISKTCASQNHGQELWEETMELKHITPLLPGLLTKIEMKNKNENIQGQKWHGISSGCQIIVATLCNDIFTYFIINIPYIIMIIMLKYDKNNLHLLRMHYVPGTVSSTFQMLMHLAWAVDVLLFPLCRYRN